MIDRGIKIMRNRTDFTVGHAKLRKVRKEYRALRDTAPTDSRERIIMRHAAAELDRVDVILNDVRRLLGLPTLR